MHVEWRRSHSTPQPSSLYFLHTVATVGATNDSVTQISQQGGRAALSAAWELLGSPPEYSGMAGWQRTSEVSCAEIETERTPHSEGRRGERCSAPIRPPGGDTQEQRIPFERENIADGSGK